MHNTDSDILAEDFMNAYVAFKMHLHEKGPFPMKDFKAFFDATVLYVKSMHGNPMIHRNVAAAVNGLRSIIELESFHAPGEAIYDADRLECMLIREYDPYFEGDEPPGL